MKSILRRIFGKNHGSESDQHDAVQEDPQRNVELENLEPRMLFTAAPVDPSPEADPEPEADPQPQTAEESVATVSVTAAREATDSLAYVERESEGISDQELVELSLQAAATSEEAALEGSQVGETEISGDQPVVLVDLDAETAQVNQETLDGIAEAAAERWQATGLTAEQSAALDSLSYQSANLPGFVMGSFDGNAWIITIDNNASGVGWFVDGTPGDDAEFGSAIDPEAAGKVDLLTLLMHEQGHALGLADGGAGIMSGAPQLGTRILPVGGEADGAIAGSITGTLNAAVTADGLLDVVDGDTSNITALIGSVGADGVISLREAIIAANNTAGDDTITLNAGTYELAEAGTGENNAVTGDLDIRLAGGKITIVGQSGGIGVINTTVDANNIDRVFHLVDTGTELELQNVIVEGGEVSETDGAGVYVVTRSTLTLDNVEFLDNEVIDSVNNNTNARGGGFYAVNNATVNGTNVIFTGNKATRSGGGETAGGGGFYANTLSTVNLDDATFTGNNAREGGGFYANAESVVNLNLSGGTGITMSGNTAREGAGFWASSGAKVDAKNLTVKTNTATIRGGGFRVGGSTALVKLTDSSIEDNIANDEHGGGFYTTGQVELINTDILSNETLDLNNANRRDGYGGGFYVGSDGKVIADSGSTISENSAYGHAGGFYNAGGEVTLTGTEVSENFTIYNNSERNGGGFWNSSGGTVTLDGALVTRNHVSLNGANLDGHGGGFFNSDQGVVNITGGTQITENMAEWGGAFVNTSNGSVVNITGTKLDPVLINDNWARNSGGGFSNNSATSAVNLSYVEISGNIAELGDGGGIRNNNGIIRADHITVDGNVAGNGNDDDGGGIFADNQSDIVITDSVISNNLVFDDGGAVFIESEPVQVRIENSIVDGNKAGVDFRTAAGYDALNTSLPFTDTFGTGTVTTATTNSNANSEGGAFYLRERALIELIDSSVTDNIARDDGGAFSTDDDPQVTISGSLISGNLAGYNAQGDTRGGNAHGGAMRTLDRTIVTIGNSAILDNEASQYGGGLMLQGDTNYTITNSTIAGNVARDHGGGVASWDNNVRGTIENTTYSGNHAGFTRAENGGVITYIQNRNGGGHWNRRGVNNFTHTTFSENVANNGAGIRRDASTVTVTASVLTGNVTNGGASANTGGTVTLVDSINSNAATASLDPLSNAFQVGAQNAGHDEGTSSLGQVQVYDPAVGATAIIDATSTERLASDQAGGGRPAGAASDRGAIESNALATAVTIDALNVPGSGVGGVEVTVDAVANSTGAGALQFAWSVTGGAGSTVPAGATTPVTVSPTEDEIDSFSFTHTISDMNVAFETLTVSLTVTDLTTLQSVTQTDTIRIVNPNAMGAGATHTYIVDKAGDIDDSNYAVGELTLREAVLLANASTAGDALITFDAGLNGTPLIHSTGGTNEDSAVSGDLDIRKTNGVTYIVGNNIVGNPANTIVDGGGVDRVFHIHSGRTLILKNLTVTGGKTQASSDDHGGGFRVEGGTVILNDVDITGNEVDKGGGNVGGGFYATNSGLNGSTVVMTGGEISSNISDDHGGGFYASGNLASTTFISLTDVDISSNRSSDEDAASDGGGFYLTGQNNVIQLDTVTIRDNSTRDDGGGFVIVGSDNIVDFDNVTIQQNVTDENVQDTDDTTTFNAVDFNETGGDRDGGGGIIAGSNNTVTFTDSLIGGARLGDGKIDFGNYSDDDGGGISIKGGNTVTFDNTVIQGNFSEDDGGGFQLDGPSTVNFTNGSKITENFSINQQGGGFIARAGTVNLTDTEITNNRAGDRIYAANPADRVGGGFYADDGATINLQDVEISGNQAEGRGGGFFVDRSTVTFTSGTPGTQTNLIDDNNVVENSTNRGGGGFYVTGSNSLVSLTDTKVTNNRSTDQGGGFYGNGAVNISLSNVEVSGNESQNEGGGFYLASDAGVVNLDTVEIKGNASRVSHGGGFRNNGTVQGTDVTISGNRTNYDLDTKALTSTGNANRVGGGFYNVGAEATVTLTRAIISDNDAYGRGGGVYNTDGTVNLTDFIVSGNTTDQSSSESQGRGGGFWNSDRGTIDLERGLLLENKSFGHGGGIYTRTDGSEVNATNVTFSGNLAGWDLSAGAYENNRVGGAIFADSGATAINLNHVTITENESTSGTNGTGGLRIDSSTTVNLENSIVYGNIDNVDSGGGNPGDIDNNVGASRFIYTGNNIVGTAAGSFGGNTAGVDGTDPNLEALAANGGFSDTHALPIGDSVAIDGSSGSTLTEDQRDSSRLYPTLNDLGAYEADNVYINEEFTAVAGTIVDGDGETAGSQDAVIGTTAFANFANLLIAYPNYAGDVIVNGGAYASTFDLTATTGDVNLLLIRDDNNLQPDVIIDDLDGDATDGVTISLFGSAVDLTVKDGDFAGVISGTGSLTLDDGMAGNTLTLSGENTYSGGTTVVEGTLAVTNPTGSATGTGAVTVEDGGTLSGDGSASGVVVVEIGGTLEPGTAADTTEAIGTGNFDHQAGGDLNVELGGVGAGASDQVVVSGSVTLAGDLNLVQAAGYTPTLGDMITIIDNDTMTDPVFGTFAGLAEGSIVSLQVGGFANHLFTISYVGGDGNDVVLTALGVQPTTDISLDGAGNLVINDIDEAVPAVNNGNSTDTLTVFVDSTTNEVVIQDPNNTLGTLIAGATQTSVGEVRVDTSLFTGDVIINGLLGDDLITIGDLGASILPLGLEVNGGDGFDNILYTGDGSVLASGGSAEFNAEEIEFQFSDLTTTDGSITLNGIGGTTSNHQGIHLLDSDLTANGGGTITLNGAGGDTGNSNHGVFLSNSSHITTTDGDIDIDGDGGGSATSVANQGVVIYSGSSLTAGGSGNLTIDGTGNAAGFYQNEGVSISSGTSASVADGDMTITGTGGGAGTGVGLGIGVSIAGTTLTGTGGGNISLTGTSIGVGSNNGGVLLNLTTISTTAGTGSVTLSGSGSSDSGAVHDNIGVLLSGTTIETGADASIDIDGTGNGTGAHNVGVALTADSDLTVTGAGTIAIDGTGSTAGTSDNDGVSLGVGTELTVANGNLTVFGTGGGNAGESQGVSSWGLTITGTGSGNLSVTGISNAGGSSNQGISLTNSTITTASTGTGSITLNGTGSANGTSSNWGVLLADSDLITGADGDIVIAGIGQGSDSNNGGVSLVSGSTVSAAGNGTVDITGAGSTAGTIFNYGVQLSGTDVSVRTLDGSLSIAGTGNGSGGYNSGVDIFGATVESTGTSGSVSLSGTGSAGASSASGYYNHGVNLSSATISTQGGALDISGVAGAGYYANTGVSAYLGSMSSNGGDLTITGAGGAGLYYNYGVSLYLAAVDSGAGKLSVLGTSQGAAGGWYNTGVSVYGGSLEGAAGSVINGTGGAGAGYNLGVSIYAVSSSAPGNLAITGTGGGGILSDDEFVYFI